VNGYDVFALFYDASIERVYRPSRERVAETLRPDVGPSVLIPACGTGQDFAPLRTRLGGGSARLVGVDFSAGMLRRARKRVDREGWQNVTLVEADARTVDAEKLGPPFDHVVCSLALSVVPDWQRVVEHTFDQLRPGGQFTIFDVHADRRVAQTLCTEWIARADLSRKPWEPLENLSTRFTLDWQPGSPHLHGGRPFIATGFKRS